MSEIDGLAPAPEASLWTTIRESLAGSHHGSYTEGSIDRAIVLLAIPMVLELVLESVFAVVDVFFVSRLGPDAIATVGLTEAMMTLDLRRRHGARHGRDRHRRAPHGRDAIPTARPSPPCRRLRSAFWWRCRSASSASAFARPILALMGATPDVLAHSSFTAILFGFNGVILMLFLDQRRLPRRGRRRDRDARAVDRQRDQPRVSTPA